MTLVASAVSLGAYAQSEFQTGYYRVVNAGYINDSRAFNGAGVMLVTSTSTAQPTATMAEAETLAGTVMYIDATPMSENPETKAQYIDINDNDLVVNNLRSQSVDASKAVYAETVADLRAWFKIFMKGNLGKTMSDDDIEATLDEMFFYMQMFLQPNEDGTYYLKSSTPNLLPLAEAIVGAKLDIDVTNPDDIKAYVIKYLQGQGQNQAADEWVALWDRIHMGHTYYLIGGQVTPDFSVPTQTFETLKGGKPFISFANDNKIDYEGIDGLVPEIEKAGDFAKWYLVPVDPQNPFGVKTTLQGRDGKFYCTGYFDFPFTSETAKAYEIKEQPVLCEPNQFGSVEPNKDDIIAYVTLTKVEGDVVPAHTPVVIECPTSDLTVLQPVETPADEGNPSVMKGIFFKKTFNETAETANDDDEFEYLDLPLTSAPEAISRKVVRVLNRGKNTLNPLGFFKFNGKEITDNKGFIVLDEAIANANIAIVDFQTYVDGINEVKNSSDNDNVIYDIQGRIVNNPTKGLYIVNGKKFIK
jgi:hypothetical protein